jgi:LDH2 family malate/lactate/ureidoglycolate dehydrogenase
VLHELVAGTAAQALGIGEEMSGYKGYGYCTVVEILSASRQGAYMKNVPGDKDGKGPVSPGAFLHSYHIEAFTTLRSFKRSPAISCANCAPQNARRRRIYCGKKSTSPFTARTMAYP